MHRTTKKCLLGSAIGHGLLFVVLVVCLAFKTTEPLPPTMTLVPPNALPTDGPSRGGNLGGSSAPQVSQPAAQPISQPSPPPVAQRQPEPTPAPTAAPVEAKPQARPVEPEPAEEEESEPEPVKQPTKVTVPKPEAKPTAKKVDLKPVGETAKPAKTAPRKLALKPTVRGASTAKSTSRSAASTTSPLKAAGGRTELASSIGKALSSIRSSNTGVTSVDDVGGGDGSGGQAFANYGDIVQTIYQSRYDSALAATGVSGASTSVDVIVTIERSGRVSNGRIVRRSGNAALDNLVEKLLERVNFVAPFPAETRDLQRKFKITFDLKAQRLAG